MSEFPFHAIARIPGLAIRLLFSVLRLKRKIKKSARRLRKAMVRGGMDRRMAKDLADRYEAGLSFRALVRTLMNKAGSSFPFSGAP
jgi:hypothetical protein